MQPDQIRRAVVTGGGHGIGRAIARRLAEENIDVVVVDIEAAAAERVAVEIGGSAYGVDVANEEAIAALIEDIEASTGPIDLFVSNAGVGHGDGADGAASREGGMRQCDDRWEACLSINLMAHVYAARHLLPRMTERGGGFFVNVASAAGLLSQIGDAAYTASKHAAVAFAESLAITHGDDGIHVSVVCPQAVATRMIGIEDDSESLDGGFLGNDVDGILRPEAVADAVMEAIKEGRFLVLPHAQVGEYCVRRASAHDQWIDGMRRFRRKLAQQ